MRRGGGKRRSREWRWWEGELRRCKWMRWGREGVGNGKRWEKEEGGRGGGGKGN